MLLETTYTLEQDNNGILTAMWIIIGVAGLYATVMAYKNYYLDKRREKLESAENWEETHSEEHF